MYPTRAIEAANATLQQRRQKARQDSLLRREELYRRYPALRGYEEQLQKAARNIAAAALEGTPEEAGALLARVREIQEERRAFLLERGLAADVLEPRYTCPLCQDTGRAAGKNCRCLDALLRAENCRDLPASVLDGRCSFASFRLDYYPDTPDQSGRSPRAAMSAILRQCRDYADHFGPGSGSLLFLGRTGLGKTHLSLAIAGQAAGQGASVLYTSAQAAVDRHERVRFDRSPTQEDRDFVRTAPRCDLLVIDDLGAEFSTSFSQSVLYNLLNDRATAGLPVILSTNLTLEQLGAAYHERITSRVLCGCTIYSFVGKDIRFLKQVEKRK